MDRSIRIAMRRASKRRNIIRLPDQAQIRMSVEQALRLMVGTAYGTDAEVDEAILVLLADVKFAERHTRKCLDKIQALQVARANRIRLKAEG
jgi:hypothetical protein